MEWIGMKDAPPAPLPGLCERPLRANPAFELVLFDRLPEDERRLLAGLARDPEHYGVLRPRRGSGLGLKAVDRETALLFLTLARPGPLPGYVRARLGDAAAAATLARLVADGVLEIEREAGRFVSGAGAMPLLQAAAAGAPSSGGGARAAAGEAAASAAGEPGSGGTPAPRGGRLVELSRAALRYGQELARTLPDADPLWLSLRLYGFNRLPLTPRWRRALPGAEAVVRHLGIAAGGPWRGLLERHWRRGPAAGAGERWLYWQPALARQPGAAPGGPGYKLYVSLAPEELAEGFGRVLDGLAAAGPPAFKVGAGAAGLLRCDKIVAYFDSFERLAEAAAALGERLAGAAAHGVPFSSEIAGDGLLSWGVDPPPAAAGQGPPWDDSGASWRLWLTHRLARALIAGVAAAAPPPRTRPVADEGSAGAEEDSSGRCRMASTGHAAMEPWRFALERLRLEGIDTDSWTPGGSLWRREGAWAWT